MKQETWTDWPRQRSLLGYMLSLMSLHQNPCSRFSRSSQAPSKNNRSCVEAVSMRAVNWAPKAGDSQKHTVTSVEKESRGSFLYHIASSNDPILYIIGRINNLVLTKKNHRPSCQISEKEESKGKNESLKGKRHGRATYLLVFLACYMWERQKGSSPELQCVVRTHPWCSEQKIKRTAEGSKLGDR